MSQRYDDCIVILHRLNEIEALSAIVRTGKGVTIELSAEEARVILASRRAGAERDLRALGLVAPAPEAAPALSSLMKGPASRFDVLGPQAMPVPPPLEPLETRLYRDARHRDTGPC